jgi:AcrR family transcriptional regulator
VLDAASRLLLAEGPQALTMRRVAGAVGCSTTVLYTAFGSKDGLADALFREGFERLRRHLEAVAPGGDPLARLRALADAYRNSALESPSYYGIMFQQAIPVRACMDAGVLRAGDPRAVAEVLWAAVHGAVSLELAGHFPDPEVAADRFRTLATAAATPFLADRPGHPSGVPRTPPAEPPRPRRP